MVEGLGDLTDRWTEKVEHDGEVILSPVGRSPRPDCCPELAQDVADVAPDGVDRDSQRPGDRAVVETAAHLLEDLQFSIGETHRSGEGRRASGRVATSPATVVPWQMRLARLRPGPTPGIFVSLFAPEGLFFVDAGELALFLGTQRGLNADELCGATAEGVEIEMMSGA